MKRDLREFAKKTNIRLIGGFLLLLFLVGDGLIFLFYGPGAAVTGLLCIVGGLFPVALIASLLYIMDKIVERANED